jgi:type IV secretion system protein VirB1
MTAMTAAAVLALVTSPVCGNVPADSDLAPHVVATVMTESGGDPLIIGVNPDAARGLPAGKMSAVTAVEAVVKASALLAKGRSIDLGLMQINNHQLARHHLTLATAFDQCANIRAGAEHLADDLAWTLAHRRYNCGAITCGVAYADAVTAKIAVVDSVARSQQQADPDDPKPPAWDLEAVAEWRRRHAPTAEDAADAYASRVRSPSPDTPIAEHIATGENK